MNAGARPELPLPWMPALRARIRMEPGDFEVEEIPATVPTGSGEHVWLEIRKTGHNTEDVAVWLARSAGVPRSAIGFAGRKDRHAVTRQWFSVHLPGRDAPDWDAHPVPGVEVLARHRHARKLQTGHLQGNRFRLRLRQIEGDKASAEEMLDRIRDRGLPAYFGEQRFGHGNLDAVRAWFRGGRPPHGRDRRSLYLSAARAAVFNAVLRRRVLDGSWDQLLPGDLANLDGRGSVFAVESVDAELRERCMRLEIHPTGPLWGRGGSAAGAGVQELESEVAAGLADLAAGLEREGLAPARRALRMRPREMTWVWQSDGDLVLELQLGPGEYATTVIGGFAEIG